MTTATATHYEATALDAYGVSVLLNTFRHIAPASEYAHDMKHLNPSIIAIYSDGSTKRVR